MRGFFALRVRSGHTVIPALAESRTSMQTIKSISQTYPTTRRRIGAHTIKTIKRVESGFHPQGEEQSGRKRSALGCFLFTRAAFQPWPAQNSWPAQPRSDNCERSERNVRPNQTNFSNHLPSTHRRLRKMPNLNHKRSLRNARVDLEAGHEEHQATSKQREA